jgi:3-deoxy-7-phosphoheptulonate synthase
MNYAIIKKLPSSDEIIESIPLSDKGYEQIAKDQKQVKEILEGRDSRLIIVAGPCSAWPKKAVLEYAEKMVVLNEKIKDKIKLIMRVYIQKPRTAKGWTGPVNQPDPFAHPDIEAGAKYVRDMMVKVIEMGLPIADEALFTHNAKGFLELLSWVAIGARSAEDQEHRIFASAIDCAVGLKNPTHGELGIGVNSVLAAQSPHVAVFDGYEVQTRGNPHAHLVLRGSGGKPNYQTEYIEQAKQHMEAKGIQNPAIIIDASHDNCLVDGTKDHRQQGNVVMNVLDELQDKPELRKLVKGFMLESFLKEGAQKLDINNPDSVDLGGLSITDPCLNWEQTENLLIELAEKI